MKSVLSLKLNKIYQDDLDRAYRNTIGLENLSGKSVLVTGCTGTIGSFLVDLLCKYNETANSKIVVFAACRSKDKFDNEFACWNDKNLHYVEYDMFQEIKLGIDVDYIIHLAGNAHPTAFANDPVGTINGNIISTTNLLEYGKEHKLKRFIYASSGEVYGQAGEDINVFTEDYQGFVDVLSSRSCYPISKRACENICASYYKQYGLDFCVVRPCHTYGPIFTESDSRANVQFFKNAINKEDIVLTSPGTQLRSYNYVADCASGILTVLTRGASGEAYNIANPKSKATIAQLAALIAEYSGTKLVFKNPTDEDLSKRSPISKQVLCAKKLYSLGWSCAFSLEEGIAHSLDILN